MIDGATCPTDDISTPGAKQQAYKLLIEKGLIRVGIPMPANSHFEVHVDSDPYGCTTNTVTGLQSPTLGIVSLYRRPLPSTNLGFDTAIMWDGREPSFTSQSNHATLIHAEATATPPTNSKQRSSLSRPVSLPRRSSITMHTNYMLLVQQVARKRCISNSVNSSSA